jgi:hypothetical protein
VQGDSREISKRFPDVGKRLWLRTFRMTEPMFYELYSKIKHIIDPKLLKQSERFKRHVCPGNKRLAVALTYLATGARLIVLWIFWNMARMCLCAASTSSGRRLVA